jgi:cytochrome oxidase Cu insertion factor (SCO1/SenC/PrrC family)
MKKTILFILTTVSVAMAGPDIGDPAPNFSLPSSVGKTVSLEDFKGKIVVLEWVNHGSPYVRRKYVWEQMQKAQRAAKRMKKTQAFEGNADAVIWLTICSSAPDKYGHMTPDQINFINRREKSAADYYLSDESGAVGRSYGATKTPEIFIVNSSGKIAYHGAFDDDTQEPGPDEVPLPNTKNYVLQALKDLVAGMPVKTPKTELFGSGIIYADQIPVEQ